LFCLAVRGWLCEVVVEMCVRAEDARWCAAANRKDFQQRQLTHSLALSRIAVSDYTGISFHFSRWRRRRHRSTLTVCRIIRLAVGGYTPARSILHPPSPVHFPYRPSTHHARTHPPLHTSCARCQGRCNKRAHRLTRSCSRAARVRCST
jgi:hypothetical protein